MKPGLYDIPAEQYHADPCPEPSLSNSIAHTILAKTPLHAWHSHPRLNPYFKSEEDSRWDLGTAAHDLLLCRTGARIAVIDADDWRKKEAKNQRDEARSNGLVPILKKHNHALNAMVNAARRAVEQSEWAGILDHGKPEQVAIWKEGSVWCRSRIDWLTNDHAVILDYKTTENANPEAWSRGHVTQLGYDMQSESYSRGIYRLFRRMPRFVFIVQEISPPFAVSFVSLSEPMREIAQFKNEMAVLRWGNCLKEGKWPGYPSETCLVHPTAWQLADYEQQKAIDDLEMKPEKPVVVQPPVTDEDAALDMFTGSSRPMSGKPSLNSLKH